MENKVKSGITGFDLLVGGGIPSGHSVLLRGPSAQESSIFINQYVKKGLENFEPVLVVLSRISPDAFRQNLRNIGVDARKYEKSGYLVIVDWYSFKSGVTVAEVEERDGVIYASKDLTHIGIAISRGLKKLPEAPIKRAVLDILSQALNFFEYKRTYNFIQAMAARSRRNNLTTIFPMETQGSESKDLSAIQAIFDGVIDLKLERVGDRIYRRVGILSMSGVQFDSRYKTYRIENYEMIIGEKKIKLEAPKKIQPEEMEGLPGEKEPSKLPTEAEQEIKSKIRKVKDNPDNADMWFDLGTTLLTYEKYEDAIRSFDKVIENDPSFTQVWNAKAEALTAVGRHEEAAECLKKSVEVSVKELGKGVEVPLMKDLEKELMVILEDVEGKVPSEGGAEEVLEFECPVCGSSVREDAIQCPSCGAKFAEMEEVPEKVLAKMEEKAAVSAPPLTTELA
ncbi:MAG: hypothetical protein JSW28_02650, partial [Thermoplasmata archaeon]